eukprot:TRINITY_DN4258_c0_g2_i1.p1 TRINITY_DN4258_c0_g2~~TRINITY_DN4258_c0_g2_i1.p1  ORF type:complete len:211 (+),score=29.99 TRINITY_DN4258_c0_g2_i1:45-677(+)
MSTTSSPFGLGGSIARSPLSASAPGLLPISSDKKLRRGSEKSDGSAGVTNEDSSMEVCGEEKFISRETTLDLKDLSVRTCPPGVSNSSMNRSPSVEKKKWSSDLSKKIELWTRRSKCKRASKELDTLSTSSKQSPRPQGSPTASPTRPSVNHTWSGVITNPITGNSDQRCMGCGQWLAIWIGAANCSQPYHIPPSPPRSPDQSRRNSGSK